MSKRSLPLILGCCISLCLSSLFAEPTDKPNILFIIADDQRWDTMSCLEDCPVETPNLDRLRNQGALFTHSYNMGSYSAAVCAASRMMLNTGAFIWNAQKFAPAKNKKQEKTSKLTPTGYWSTWMQQAGYETYMSGKWHVPGVSVNKIFDHVVNVRPGMPRSTGSYDRKFIPGEPDGWSSDTTKKGFWEGGKHWSEVLADDAESLFQKATETEKPFFMYLAFNAPHDPRQAPEEYLEKYPVNDIEPQANFIPEYPHNEDIGAGRSLRDERLAPFPRTEHSVKVSLKEYYSLITHMDTQIGRILDALEASGKADNTYIFFTADHGLAIGAHGLLGKQNMYDHSMRVPLIVAGPGIDPGKTLDAQVYLQDIMATSLEIAGADKPDQVEFNSLLPLATGKTEEGGYRDIYGAYFDKQRMYRNDRYKLIIYPNAKVVRLFDIANDPDEMNDLAKSKERPVELLNTLFSEFKKLQKSMNDPIDVSEVFQDFMSRP